MTKLVNRAKMTTASTGTGSPITLGSAVDGYQTFSAAGVADADVVRYVIEDGDAWEIGLGTYTASGTTLTRGSIESSNADNALNLTGNAVVYVSAAAADLQELVDFADNFVLPTSDGSTGQVLTTNGAGTLSFTTISGYTDSDVDTHLNTSTASSGEVLSWTGSDYDWVAAPASLTGQTDTASPYETSLGFEAGFDNTGFYNTFIGYQSSKTGCTGNSNTALGSLSLANLTSGYSLVAIGRSAGEAATTAGQSTLVGHNSGKSVTSSSGNTAVGWNSLFSATTGAYNVSVGPSAAFALTTGSNNVAIGNGALDAATTGGRNIAIGQDAMGSGVATASTGDNVAIGYQAGYDLTSGEYNTLLGYQAGANLTTGASNVSIGEGAIRDGNGGSGYNVAIGRLAGQNLSGSALRNVTIGEEAGANSNGAYNIGIGYNATKGASAGSFTGGYNIGIGEYPIAALTTGSDNIGIGRRAGFDLTSGANNFLGGYQAGTNLTTGSYNVALGQRALDAATTGGQNVAIGRDAGGSLTGASENTYVGDQAGANITGSSNTALGYLALYGGASPSTLQSTSIGYFSGYRITSGIRNTFVGASAGSDATNGTTTGTNNTIIGYDANASSATVSNEITLGNSSITRFRIPGIQSGASDGDVLTYDATNGILSLQAGGGSPLGDGQTWAASGKGITTTYQNTSGRTIAVSVLCNATQFNTLEIKVGTNASGSSNPIVAKFSDFTTASGIGLTVSAVVPDGHYYYVDAFGGAISSFMELT
jgi:hypothetical protein